MWYIFAAVILIAATSAFGLSRTKGGPPGEYQLLEKVLDRVTLSSLSMEQVNGLLARLQLQEPPEPVMGAMCYEAMAYPAVAEYICPVCGEKTIYDDYNTPFIEWELQGCRRMAEFINGITEFQVTLDERLFCDFCSPDREGDPALLLRVASTDSTETVNSVTVYDLRLLESFLQGRLYYLTENDSQLPLREHADRLRELLGVPEAP
ncbi:MAG: hypothetical protein JXA64_00130 [Candidatus Fermentibacteraceae bacterium]|nr:hypothetical protein [Candidatus Fermentibacteraceae bacterium]MBN2607491.1 hypothetical protein [Candidatus Fermentibacteraceae bacterium]